MQRKTFRRAERLKSKKEIAKLFSGRASSFGQYPLRLVWQVREDVKSPYPVQVGFSVPKRRFKLAVTRNLIKRRIREAYRLQKPDLYEQIKEDGKQYSWMILYVGKEVADYGSIEKAMRKMIRRFLEKRG